METMIGILIIIVGSYLYNMFMGKAKTQKKRSINRIKKERTAEKTHSLSAKATKEIEPNFIRHSKRNEREDHEARAAFEIKEAAEEQSAMTIQEKELVKGIILSEVLGPPRAKRNYFS
ncbi:hypothetical protein [Bacillus smithii]|uniref:hypothetical protein n=1 Tax=Bacillus smithii TaxID=1479 RepID=UPI0030C97AAD